MFPSCSVLEVKGTECDGVLTASPGSRSPLRVLATIAMFSTAHQSYNKSLFFRQLIIVTSKNQRTPQKVGCQPDSGAQVMLQTRTCQLFKSMKEKKSPNDVLVKDVDIFSLQNGVMSKRHNKVSPKVAPARRVRVRPLDESSVSLSHRTDRRCTSSLVSQKPL